MQLNDRQRMQLDLDVLREVCRIAGNATYYYRNCLDWPGDRWHRTGLETYNVLSAMRRLERAGLVEQAPTSYAVMLAWRPTDLGRAAVEASTFPADLHYFIAQNKPGRPKPPTPQGPRTGTVPPKPDRIVREVPIEKILPQHPT